MKKCVICKQDIKEHGNNAQPVAEGQCCDECNATKVIPARLRGHCPSMSMSEALELSTQLKGIE